MNIKASDLVLEIGSGNNPNPRADILCDRYLNDNGERAGKFSIVIDRPIIIADGYTLPFDDKSFDYVICSHILEHMDHSREFIEEVERVGKRGYIEVPSALSERIFGWDFHHWYCTIEHNQLTLRKKTEGEQFGGFFHRLIKQTIWFRRFFEEHEETMYVRYEWERSVRMKIIHQEPIDAWKNKLSANAWKLLSCARPDFAADLQFYIQWMTRRMKRKLSKIFRRMIWNIKIIIGFPAIHQRITQLVCCVECRKQGLRFTRTSCICIHCGATYPVVSQTIPVLLTKNELAKGY